MGIINEKFPGSFSVRQLTRAYSLAYGEEINPKKVSCALTSLWMDGILEKRVIRQTPKGNKNRYHAIRRITSRSTRNKTVKAVSRETGRNLS